MLAPETIAWKERVMLERLIKEREHQAERAVKILVQQGFQTRLLHGPELMVVHRECYDQFQGEQKKAALRICIAVSFWKEGERGVVIFNPNDVEAALRENSKHAKRA